MEDKMEKLIDQPTFIGHGNGNQKLEDFSILQSSNIDEESVLKTDPPADNLINLNETMAPIKDTIGGNLNPDDFIIPKANDQTSNVIDLSFSDIQQENSFEIPSNVLNISDEKMDLMDISVSQASENLSESLDQISDWNDKINHQDVTSIPFPESSQNQGFLTSDDESVIANPNFINEQTTKDIDIDENIADKLVDHFSGQAKQLKDQLIGQPISSTNVEQMKLSPLDELMEKQPIDDHRMNVDPLSKIKEEFIPKSTDPLMVEPMAMEKFNQPQPTEEPLIMASSANEQHQSNPVISEDVVDEKMISHPPSIQDEKQEKVSELCSSLQTKDEPVVEQPPQVQKEKDDKDRSKEESSFLLFSQNDFQAPPPPPQQDLHHQVFDDFNEPAEAVDVVPTAPTDPGVLQQQEQLLPQHDNNDGQVLQDLMADASTFSPSMTNTSSGDLNDTENSFGGIAAAAAAAVAEPLLDKANVDNIKSLGNQVVDVTTKSAPKENVVVEEEKTCTGAAQDLIAVASSTTDIVDDFLPTSASTIQQLSSAPVEEQKKEDNEPPSTTTTAISGIEPTPQQLDEEQFFDHFEQKEEPVKEEQIAEPTIFSAPLLSSSSTLLSSEPTAPPPPAPTPSSEQSLDDLQVPINKRSKRSLDQPEEDEQEISAPSQQPAPPPTTPTPLTKSEQETTKPSKSTEEQKTTDKKIMGRKNYNRQNSGDASTSAANSEPDCIHHFIQTLFGQCAADILYWRDPKNTGAVFGVGLVILFSLTIFSVISVVAYTLLFTLLATLSFRVYKNVMQAVNKTEDGHPFKEYLEVDITPNQERAHEIADQLLSHFNCFITRMRSVLLVEDYVESFKYLFLFWALTFIGAWFNGMTLVILAYIGAFSLPKVYEMNKSQIDQHLNLVLSKINEITDKIPFLKKTSAEKKDN